MQLSEDNIRQSVTSYIDLLERYPELFPMRERIVTDPEKLVQFALDNGKVVGLAYSSPWHYLLVDVVADADGGCSYAYERYVAVSRNCGGVAIPILPDGRICLLKNYRHTLGQIVLELPRGYSLAEEPGQNAAIRELSEELGATALSAETIGTMIADSGVNGDIVTIVKIEIGATDVRTGHEGITGFRTATLGEIDEMISSGEVRDGFTLGAIAMLKAK